jgi:hypothetical protein
MMFLFLEMSEICWYQKDFNECSIQNLSSFLFFKEFPEVVYDKHNQ